ncbi:DegT/DnrJ/EryC1/StrS family aminotransferase [Fretibacterium sp. OH1220_COT-178]|uniref:DegT/DnrJ/EryC1/StrS family aminotransferase n=1 Tax=Fretibacterium sp. OH1220_COT-178 TaxID=2491047 RepID=UPI000F5FDCBA|nr:DegT/DnrJ/EryC1/StrS family aminotransferase [Fretibacterium sp. OH1220_COT-178]RRD64154.1 DegT/DnrJ/EryC1/StrS family aminotransferase [Fretibacterium sp. OH1220_COT-178]
MVGVNDRLPILDLSRAHAEIRDEVRGALERVFDAQSFILGREVRTFEEHVESYLEIPDGSAVGCASGTDALLLALMALDVGPGDEVVTTPYSFFATAAAVVRLGATPVFADIDPATYNIDLNDVERRMTPRTKVFLPVHLFGQTVPIEGIAELCAERGVAIVEDAAQAFGAWRRVGDRIERAGAMGDVGCFSFFPTKNLGGCGDGGMVAARDAGRAGRMRRLRVHGEGSTYFHEEVGLNSRLDALQAAVLDVKLPYLERWNSERRLIADRYRMFFESRGLTDRVTLPEELEGNHHIYHQYVVRVTERDGLMAHLEGQGIGARVYYPLPLHLQPCFAFLGGRPGDFPEAERLSREALALPVFPGLRAEEQERLVDAVEAFLG